MASAPRIPSLSSYQGLLSRVCDALNLTPSVLGRGEAKTTLEFDALAKWCDDQANQKRKKMEAASLFGE